MLHSFEVSFFKKTSAIQIIFILYFLIILLTYTVTIRVSKCLYFNTQSIQEC